MVFFPSQWGSCGNESYEKRAWCFNLSPAGQGETWSGAGLSSCEVEWPQARVNSIFSWVGYEVKRRHGRGGKCWGGCKQCEPLFPTYHPLGSQRRRHAGATSSPPVASHVKPGDFSSTLARMLFLPRLWVGLLDKRVSSCAIIIPQVFGWREGPSHLLKTGVGQKSVGMQVCKPRRHSLSLTCWAISVLTFLVHLHSRDISNW